MAGAETQSGTVSSGNGQSALHDLFALTDEQILEIEPEAPEPTVPGSAPSPFSLGRASGSHQTEVGATLGSPGVDGGEASAGGASPAPTHQSSEVAPHRSPVASHVPQEPPPWLAAQMKDPWSGEEARELWNGVQQARQEAAAYRAAFATPEDARALKELYPSGVNEARGAAERARQLDEIDRAYFGAAGKSAQEISASRAQLAQTMLRENPAAFREMVFAGLRALEGSSGVEATLSSRAEPRDGSPGNDGAGRAAGGASPAPTTTALSGSRDSRITEHEIRDTAHEAQLAAYSAFERAANEDLERSVGAAIERTLNQALPNANRTTQDASSRAGQAQPLQARLSAAIRQDVEAALKGDRQLGEQVTQILSGRRLDQETRAQVVRLIGERAQQLVPVAAKRVLNEWTQTTLAAHRSPTAKAEAASTRREVAPASPESRRASLPAGSSASSGRDRSPEPNRGHSRSEAHRVDYRKLSDEQILDM